MKSRDSAAVLCLLLTLLLMLSSTAAFISNIGGQVPVDPNSEGAQEAAKFAFEEFNEDSLVDLTLLHVDSAKTQDVEGTGVKYFLKIAVDADGKQVTCKAETLRYDSGQFVLVIGECNGKMKLGAMFPFGRG